MKKKYILCLIASLVWLAPLSVCGASFDTVVVFGDSLSDNGNLFASSPSSVPTDLYYQGRFSNGPVWAEYLVDADRLDCTLDDNAYAGAETQGASPPGLVEQVAIYVASTPLPENALFVVWIGANDFLNQNRQPADSVANIETALQALALFGAEDILILNLPDLGATPRMLGTADAATATATTQAFNTTLASAVDDFETDFPDITVYELDIYGLFESIIADPDTYGFSNATEVSPNFAVANAFDNSAGYVFWDEIHPTTEAHEEIGQRAYLLLVPESDADDDSGSECFIDSILY